MDYAEIVGNYLIANNLKISTTESCTGGLLSSRLTDVSGSSSYITYNLVTYASDVKREVLGVEQKVLDTYGVVSKECAYQMAKGLFDITTSDICVSTTGIAGPTGGTKDKPVGLMYSTIYTLDKYKTYEIKLDSSYSRIELKRMFTEEVLKNLIEFLGI